MKTRAELCFAWSISEGRAGHPPTLRKTRLGVARRQMRRAVQTALLMRTYLLLFLSQLPKYGGDLNLQALVTHRVLLETTQPPAFGERGLLSDLLSLVVLNVVCGRQSYCIRF